MNICFHKSWSNCQNIDNHLYICGNSECNCYKAPLTIYNRYNDRTPLTMKSFIYFIINLFTKKRKLYV